VHCSNQLNIKLLAPIAGEPIGEYSQRINIIFKEIRRAHEEVKKTHDDYTSLVKVLRVHGMLIDAKELHQLIFSDRG
jgi:hypothetical protein